MCAYAWQLQNAAGPASSEQVQPTEEAHRRVCEERARGAVRVHLAPHRVVADFGHLERVNEADQLHTLPLAHQLRHGRLHHSARHVAGRRSVCVHQAAQEGAAPHKVTAPTAQQRQERQRRDASPLWQSSSSAGSFSPEPCCWRNAVMLLSASSSTAPAKPKLLTSLRICFLIASVDILGTTAARVALLLLGGKIPLKFQSALVRCAACAGCDSQQFTPRPPLRVAWILSWSCSRAPGRPQAAPRPRPRC